MGQEVLCTASCWDLRAGITEILELLQLELPLCISVFLAGSLWSPLLFRSAHAELAHCTGDWQCEITLWDH